LGFLSNHQKSAITVILQKVTSQETRKYLITFVADMILGKKFIEKKDEWKMIAKKTQKWMKAYRATAA
jgi:hypothetical protein